MDKKYFVRIRGKIGGPFDTETLQSMARRGRFARHHEVSPDRQTWYKAAEFPELFPERAERRKVQSRSKGGAADAGKGGKGNTAQTTSEEAASDGYALTAAPAETARWYYGAEGEQSGPVTTAQLRELYIQGTLSKESYVWNPDMADWVPVIDVPELASFVSGNDASPSPDDPISQNNSVVTYSPSRLGQRAVPSATAKKSATAQHFDDLASGRLWTAILNTIRQIVTVDVLEQTTTVLMHWGGFAMIGAMLVVPPFMAYVAIKADSIRLFLLAIAAFFGLNILKYVGQRMSAADHNLVQQSPSRLATPAFLDSAALLLLSIGVALASGEFLLAIQSDAVWYTRYIVVLAALQALIVFGYAACIALQPDWLNIECPSNASGGEEGIGVLSFYLKVLLRFAVVNFGVGTILSTVGISVGVIVYLSSNDLQGKGVGIELATESGIGLVGAALFPLLAYLVSSLFLIPLDVTNSILQVPGKLDDLSASNGDSNGGD